MGHVDVPGRRVPEPDGDEVTTLLAFLDYQRDTVAWKCRGVDAAGLRVTVGPSPMTLGGLLKHLAYVEDDWLTVDLHDRPFPQPWAGVDWRADRDWEWHSAAQDTPEELFALWERSVARSRDAVAEALADGGLDRRARRPWHDGRPPSLRWILCHLIEEYARHAGHADLLREAVDGATGD